MQLIAVTVPALATEYDTARYGIGPDQLLSRSAQMAFWKDANGHMGTVSISADCSRIQQSGENVYEV